MEVVRDLTHKIVAPDMVSAPNKRFQSERNSGRIDISQITERRESGIGYDVVGYSIVGSREILDEAFDEEELPKVSTESLERAYPGVVEMAEGEWISVSMTGEEYENNMNPGGAHNDLVEDAVSKGSYMKWNDDGSRVEVVGPHAELSALLGVE